MNTLLLALALVIGVVIKTLLAADAEQVTIGSEERVDGGRLTIEWSSPIRVLQKKEGNRLILRFSRPLSADIRPALSRLATYLDVDRAAVEGTDLTLRLNPDVAAELRVKNQRTVTIDLTSRQPNDEMVELTVSKLQDGIRLTADWPRPIGFKTWDQDGKLEVTFTLSGRFRPSDLDYLNRTFQPWFSYVQPLRRSAGTSLAFSLKPLIVPSVRSRGERRVEIDLVRDAAAASKPIKAASKPKIRQESPKPPPKLASEDWPPMPKRRPAIPDAAANAGEQSKPEKTVSDESESRVDALVFHWEEGVGASVFKRAGYLWTVFDAPKEFSRSPLPPPSPGSLMAGEMMEADQATIIRFPIRSDTDFSVRRDETGRWMIEPDDDPKTPTSIPISSGEASGTLQATAPSNGRIVNVTDPLVGDQLSIWPIQQAGIGQPTRRRFVDLEIQRSIQGLVWRPLNDDLMAIADYDAVEFRSGQGLTLSNWLDGADGETAPNRTAEQQSEDQSKPDDRSTTEVLWRSDTGEAEADPILEENKTSPPEKAVVEQLLDEAVPSSYFNLAGSGVDRDLVTETRRVLRQTIGRSAPDQQNKARLDLARVLVAENLASEAKVILQTMPGRLEGPTALSNRALRGAAAFLAGDVDQASTLLQASELDDDGEIGIWRAALRSLEQDWRAAAQGWKEVSGKLDIYPPKLRLELGLLALEAAIETDDDDQIRIAFRRLKTLELEPRETAKIDRLQAKKAMRDGDQERAEEILRKIADGRYPIISKMADFELATLRQKNEPNDAGLLTELHERLPLWRGHPEEITMIDRLASRYRDAGEPRPALQLWERLSTTYPKTEDDVTIKNERRATYVDALTNLAGERIGLFDAYSIYLDFINLMPEEPDDRPVYRSLARHLAGLDLLDEAVSVLQPLLERTADEVEAATIGAKVAELLLFQDRLDEALVLLDRTEIRGGEDPDDLNAERKILRARALAGLDRREEALEQIKDLQTRPARHVRAEIFWQQRNWNRLANVIETVLGDPNLPRPLGHDDQKLVLWLVLARDQLGQTRELSELRQRYAAEMASGPWNEAFTVGTQTDGQSGDIDSLLSQTENQLAELRRFRGLADADR